MGAAGTGGGEVGREGVAGGGGGRADNNPDTDLSKPLIIAELCALSRSTLV